MSHYENHESVATAEWVQDNLDTIRSDDPDVRLVEVDMKPEVYDDWHIPGAVQIDWETDIVDGLGGDLVDPDGLSSLLGGLGITPETTVVVYGDRANWFAGHALWVLRYYEHADVRLLDGGRRYWELEGYETATTEPEYTAREYTVSGRVESIRADRTEVQAAVDSEENIVDVRNPMEYRGEKPPAEVPDTTEAEGHVPTAENVPWGEAVAADGRFRPEPALRAVYDDVIGEAGTVTYCRIGERSSITWFVIEELLDEQAVNYDGSWTDWTDAPETRVVTGPEPDDDGGDGA